MMPRVTFKNQRLRPTPWSAIAVVVLAVIGTQTASAQTARRDLIAEMIAAAPATADQATTDPKKAAPELPIADPRAGDVDYEQAKALMSAIDEVLKEAADTRVGASRLPSRDDFILPPLWAETREDRDGKIRALLETALAIVTDVKVVDIQKRIETLRRNIQDIETQTAQLRERQLVAPKDATFPGILTETQATLETAITANTERIANNRTKIQDAKTEIVEALTKAGIDLDKDQVELLLGSVLSGDLVRLVAVFNAAKQIDVQLARRINATGDNMNAARKYFAMHAALFAMLVHAQDSTIKKIDTQYMPKLDAILSDIKAAQSKTSSLLRGKNRPDQIRALKANAESQKLARDAAVAYQSYLHQQREQIAKARIKAAHDLSIADNTYETVEASVQLRNLMRESAASFEAIQKLEAPSFEQIFKNDELRREFENLTRRLDVPSS